MPGEYEVSASRISWTSRWLWASQLPLFLPPEDHGTAVCYVLDRPGHKDLEVTILLAYVSPAYGGDSPVMDAYRKRNIAAGASLLAAVRQAGLHLAAGDGALGNLSAEEARETVAKSPYR